MIPCDHHSATFFCHDGMYSNVPDGVTCPDTFTSPLVIIYWMSLLNPALSTIPSCHFCAVSFTQDGICVVAVFSICCFSLFASAIRCWICSSIDVWSSGACGGFCVFCVG